MRTLDDLQVGFLQR